MVEEEPAIESEVSAQQPEPIACYKCGTELVNAPGIGPFCPNKSCDVVDNTNNATTPGWMFTPPMPVVLKKPEPEKSVFEQHPYLNNTTVGVGGTPLVAPAAEPAVEEPEILAIGIDEIGRAHV